MFRVPTLLAGLLGLLGVTPRSVLAATKPPPCAPLDHEHPAWTGLLLKDPRIHFAIGCASRSCPELRGEAYRARYAEPAAAEVLRRKGRALGFLAYDWSLNGR